MSSLTGKNIATINQNSGNASVDHLNVRDGMTVNGDIKPRNVTSPIVIDGNLVVHGTVAADCVGPTSQTIYTNVPNNILGPRVTYSLTTPDKSAYACDECPFPLNGTPTFPAPVTPIVLKTPISDVQKQIELNTYGWYSWNVRDNIWCICDGYIQCLVFITSNGCVLWDAPASHRAGVPCFPPVTNPKTLVQMIQGITSNPVTTVFYSHYHADHIGAVSFVKAQWPECKIIANERAVHNLCVVADPLRPQPDIVFDRAMTIVDGGEYFELFYVGNTHTDDSVIWNYPKGRILGAVCVILPEWVPFKEYSFCQNLTGYFLVNSIMSKCTFDGVMGGNFDALGTKQIAESNNAYINQVDSLTIPALLNSANWCFPVNPNPVSSLEYRWFGEAFNRVAEQVWTDMVPFINPATDEWSNGLYGPLRGATHEFVVNHAFNAAVRRMRLEQGVGLTQFNPSFTPVYNFNGCCGGCN